MKTFALVLSLSLITVFSCGDGGQKKLADEGVRPSLEKKEAVATVGDVVITKSDLAQILQSTHPILKSRYENLEGREELLNKMIARAVLYMEGTRQGIQAEVDVTKSIEDYKIDLISEIVKNRFLGKEISDKAVEDYYKKNKERYSSKSKMSFDAVSRSVKADLSRELIEKYVEELKKKYPVKINRALLNK